MGKSDYHEAIDLNDYNEMLERTTVLYNDAQKEILLHADANVFKVTVNDKKLQLLKSAARRRGVKLKYITEITPENLTYCKRQMALVDELRHHNRLKGNFVMSESQYMVSPEISDLFPFTKGAHGNNEIILKLCRDIFENSWTYSIPAEQRISEIEAQKINGTKSRLKESHHEPNGIYQCAYCSMLFGTDAELTDHQKDMGHR
jgi:hypothetical protein